ncbi:MAG: ribose 5-phosphate isomerase A [Candidatus Azobacteroides sp.]|nr:ribose 5-phosphate isomerase A [Candidatus Azobacteroides sp.]
MKWEKNIIDNLKWPVPITNRKEKEQLAKEIASRIKDKEVIGVGSGSTSYLALLAIAERVKKEKMDIRVIPTSMEISFTCVQLGLPQVTLLDKKPDWTFDGADEVDPGYNLIKGRGGAMFKEKLLIRNSNKTYILIDKTKRTEKLGTNFPVPVEVFPPALVYVDQEIKKLGIESSTLRSAQGKDRPVITENGNYILDVHFTEITNTLEKQIKEITGVIESGLFIGYDVEVLTH